MAYVTWVLRHCGHNGFPVVRGSPGDSSDEEEEEEAEGESGSGGSSGTASSEGRELALLS